MSEWWDQPGLAPTFAADGTVGPCPVCGAGCVGFHFTIEGGMNVRRVQPPRGPIFDPCGHELSRPVSDGKDGRG